MIKMIFVSICIALEAEELFSVVFVDKSSLVMSTVRVLLKLFDEKRSLSIENDEQSMRIESQT